MKYTARIGDRDWIVEVETRGDGLALRIDGAPAGAVLEETPDRGSSLLLDGTRHPVDVRDGDGEILVTVGAREYVVRVEDERERAAHSVRPAGGGGPRVVRSVMPGIVRQVLVAEGETVEARRPLLVLEAMKMQNEVRAGSDGVVTRIHVRPGATVARGDPLFTVGDVDRS